MYGLDKQSNLWSGSILYFDEWHILDDSGQVFYFDVANGFIAKITHEF